MWARVKAWCNESVTIFWARTQMLIGAVWTALSAVDLSPVLPPKWLPVWLVFSGVVTELTRRRSL